MLYLSDITDLLSQWEGRLKEDKYNSAYKDAVSDCIYELKSMVDDKLQQEAKRN